MTTLTRIIALTASLLTLAGTAVAQDQSVKLTTALTADRELAFQVTQDLTMKQVQTEQPEKTERFAHAANIALKVISVREDQSATLSLKFTDVAALVNAAGRVAVFKGSTGLPLAAGDADALAAASADESLDSVMNAVLACSVELDVDASFQVTRIAGLEPALEAMNAQQVFVIGDGPGVRPDPRTLGFMTVDNLSELVTRLLSIEGAGLDPRTVGGGWQTTRTVKLPPVGAIDITNNWAFPTLTDNIAAVNGDFSMEAKLPAEPTPDTATFSITEQQGGTTIEWNTADNALQSRQTNQNVTSEWRLASANIALTMTQDFKLTIERK